MSNHRLRQDAHYKAGYDDGIDHAQAGCGLCPEALERCDPSYRLGYANGQRHSLGLDPVEPPLPPTQPEQALPPTPEPTSEAMFETGRVVTR